MDYAEITEFIIVFLFAATKFAFAVGYMLLPSHNYSYYEVVVTLVSGGSFGIIVFYFFSNWINLLLNKLIKRKKKKVFTKNTRRFVRIKNNYGLYGIALITPIILSIPIGSFLASRFFRHNKFTLPVMIAGVVFWAFLLPLIKLYY